MATANQANVLVSMLLKEDVAMGVFYVTPHTRSPAGCGRREPGIALANRDPSWLEGSAQVPILTASD